MQAWGFLSSAGAGCLGPGGFCRCVIQGAHSQGCAEAEAEAEARGGRCLGWAGRVGPGRAPGRECRPLTAGGGESAPGSRWRVKVPRGVFHEGAVIAPVPLEMCALRH